MSFVRSGLPCPKCDSSDAYAIDENDWGKCFSCNVNIPPEQGDNIIPIPVGNTRMNAQVKLTLFTEALTDRKITADTCKMYGVGFHNGDLYFPLNEGLAYKVRVNGEKQFRIDGDFQNAKHLFGRERFAEGGNRIVVTEGELDAMALHQMSGKYNIPVVSVRNGAASAVRDIKENYEYLDTFGEVIFWFDNDAAGKQAADACAEVFVHKAKVVKGLPEFKDACDYLKANRSADAMKVFWNAQRWTPEGIVNADSMYDEVMKPLAKADAHYPFDGLNKLTYGIRRGELITVTAGSGLGKSQFIREMIYHIYKETNDNLGLMFFEESRAKTLLSLMSLSINKPLHLPTTEATQEEKDEAYKNVASSGRLFMTSQFGSADIDTVVNRVRYLSKAVDCRYIFLDHISIIMSAQSNGDERKGLDEIMTRLRMLVEETGISLVCVSHLKRPDKKGHEEGAATSLAQLRGSGSIAQLSDMVLGLERNGQAEDDKERNTTYVRVLKNRFAGITGKACALYYDLNTNRMTETIEDDAL